MMCEQSEGEYQYEQAMIAEAGKPEMDERTWITKEGREIKVADMDDSHLINTIRMLRRKAGRMKLAAELECISAESMFNGDMAKLSIEQEGARISGMSDEDFLMEHIPPYRRMLREVRIRNLDA